MKKYIPGLLAFALAVTACNLDEEFSATNITDLVTVESNTSLVNDYGTVYHITADMSDHDWAIGDRLYALFDLLNSNYDITLKSYSKCIVIKPVPYPEGDFPVPMADPVIIDGNSISAGYVNLQLTYYKQKNSNFAHRILMYYKDKPDSQQMELYLVHQGNGENPANLEDDELETVTALFSFPLAGLAPGGSRRTVYLTYNELYNNSQVVSRSAKLYDQDIYF